MTRQPAHQDKAFNRQLAQMLRDFRRRMDAALAVPDPRLMRARVKAVKQEWKVEHGTYYVNTYTVQAHFRRIPSRK